MVNQPFTFRGVFLKVQPNLWSLGHFLQVNSFHHMPILHVFFCILDLLFRWFEKTKTYSPKGGKRMVTSFASPEKKHQRNTTQLVGGFNPVEIYQSNGNLAQVGVQRMKTVETTT